MLDYPRDTAHFRDSIASPPGLPLLSSAWLPLKMEPFLQCNLFPARSLHWLPFCSAEWTVKLRQVIWRRVEPLTGNTTSYPLHCTAGIRLAITHVWHTISVSLLIQPWDFIYYCLAWQNLSTRCIEYLTIYSSLLLFLFYKSYPFFHLLPCLFVKFCTEFICMMKSCSLACINELDSNFENFFFFLKKKKLFNF